MASLKRIAPLRYCHQKAGEYPVFFAISRVAAPSSPHEALDARAVATRRAHHLLVDDTIIRIFF
jgi:hypothetical protein